MKVVLISGKMASGKTTLQKALCEKWYASTGQGATFVNFADTIYEMHDAVLKILQQYWPRQVAKDRDLLQLLGTEWGRKKIDSNIWVKILQTKVEMMNRAASREPLVIVGDCRFPNEVDAFPEALRIRLECSEDARRKRCTTAWQESSGHTSETALDEYAEQGKFDLYLNTETTPADGCLALAWVALEKNSWLERRK